MADFGVLNAVRQLLKGCDNVQSFGAADNIHHAVPPSFELPMILIEIEEIWTAMKGVPGSSAAAKLRLKTSIMSKPPSGMDSVRLSSVVSNLMDGKTLRLVDGKVGVVKMFENIIEIPAANKPRSVKQYYEVLVRERL